MNNIYGNTINMSARSLDYLWQKQQLISNNIANVDTPGYKSRYLTFEDTFKSEIEKAAKKGNASSFSDAIENAKWKVNTTENETARLDGNNVQLDVELIEMTRTTFHYRSMLNSVNSDLTRLTTAIKGQ